ncbi:MAG: DUF1801 domain-containing protein [Chloroflexi bacterium]|nr:DUF1801 domain-containing protein [Chloroflexota bacterium]
MTELKTQRNDGDVQTYLDSVKNKRRREDALVLLDVMSEITGEPAEMWGGSIVGFGSYHYVYESGREGDWFLTGFAPRKQSMTLYIMPGFEHYEDLLARLGKHRIGRSCLYINKLADVDMDVLRDLVAGSVAHMRRTRGATESAGRS